VDAASTALNVDVYAAWIRFCLAGDFYHGGQWLYGRRQTIKQVIAVHYIMQVQANLSASPGAPRLRARLRSGRRFRQPLDTPSRESGATAPALLRVLVRIDPRERARPGSCREAVVPAPPSLT
jgi:hypothetical protein